MRFIDLQEGPNDPGIFKAVFLAGGPGSGKGYVVQQLGLASRGLRVLNSDDALEFLMRKHDLSFNMPPEEQPQRDVVRQRAKELTNKKQDIYIGGRLGLIIDGTAKDVDKMAKLKTELEAIGYQTMMVFVNTSLRTALQRNLLRDRKVPTDIVTQSHKQVQANKDSLEKIFAPNYVEVNNDDNANFNEPLKRIDRFIDAPVTAKARDWVSKASVQKSIAQEDVQSKPKVYVDMDGVLANFYAGVTRVTGHAEPRDMALQDIEDTMASFKGTDFFYKLPKYEQTDQLIAMVNAATKGDWYILSSPLKYDREGSAKHKAAWVKKYLKIQPRDMHFTGDKAQFALQPDGTPNILIDDYPKYLNSWKEKGGIGVQYKGHAGNIGDVKATLDQYFSKKKVAEETRQPGEYVYHASYVGDDKARWLRSLIQRGLQPSDHGYSGPGTYFAYKPDEGYYHVTPEDSMILRVKWKDLISLFGVYPAKSNGIERDDDEIIVPGTVPASMIEVEYFDNEWWDLKSALETETHQYETIRKVKSGYRLVSKSGKNLGTYPSKTGAVKRERQVQYFKHMGENTVLTEEQLVEGFLDSAKNYLGDYYNKTSADFKSAVVDLKQAGVLIKDVLSDPKQTEIVNAQIGKRVNMLLKSLKSSTSTAVVPMIEFVQQKILPIVRAPGVRGFLGRLGLYGVLQFVVEQLSKITDTVTGQVLDVLGDLVSQLSTTAITMSSFMGIFENLTFIKKYFLDVLSSIKSKLMSVQINPQRMGEQGRSTAVEPHEPGYQHSLLTAPQNTLVIDKSDDMDFYKLGQHYTSLANYDKHELGVGPSDMTITFASPEEMERMKGVFDKLGVKYKDISGSHEEPEIHSKESRVNEVADSPYDYAQNVKTPDKRAYRFQTEGGKLYRVQVFNRRSDTENKLEIHFDLTDMKTGKPDSGVTGTGDAIRVFSTVANILQKEVAQQKPTGVIIASKADDESRVKLYRTLARRATKLMPGYEVARERQVTGGDGNPYLTIELAKK